MGWQALLRNQRLYSTGASLKQELARHLSCLSSHIAWPSHCCSILKICLLMHKNFLLLTLVGRGPGWCPSPVASSEGHDLWWPLEQDLPHVRCFSQRSAVQLGLSTGSCVGVASLSRGSCSRSLGMGRAGTVGAAFFRHCLLFLAEARGRQGKAV